jgi:hypothetical protein
MRNFSSREAVRLLMDWAYTEEELRSVTAESVITVSDRRRQRLMTMLFLFCCLSISAL